MIGRVTALIALLSAPTATLAHAQHAPLPIGPTDSATIALIEAEGAAHPRTSPAPPYPEHFLAGWIAFPERFGLPPVELGSPERRCAAVPAGGVVERRFDRIRVPTAYMRSGEFHMAGGRAMVHGEGQKLPWTPAWPTRGMELLLRARRLTAPTATIELTITNVLYEDRSDNAPLPWEASFPTRIVFPSPGTWVVVGTTGVNWGCLVYRVS